MKQCVHVASGDLDDDEREGVCQLNTRLELAQRDTGNDALTTRVTCPCL